MQMEVPAGRGSARWGRRVAAAVLACLAASPGAAQEGAGTLALEDALQSALRRGVDVRIARERLLASRGTARAARGAFDTQITSFLGSSRAHTLRFTGDGAPRVEPSRTSGISYGVAVDRRLRNGVVVSPQLGAKRVMTSPEVEARNTTASVDLVVQVPLLRGTGGAFTAAERAAEIEVRASAEELRYAASASVLDAAVAYWGYAATVARLEVHRQVEERARRLVERTRALIAAQERPAADLNPLLANLAQREATRIAAEQERVASRERLALAMGLDAAEAAALPAPAAALPSPDSAAPPETAALLREARERRGDLLAARHVLSSAELRVAQARNGTRPRLDVQVSVGYSGAEAGSDIPGLVTPFGSVAGWNGAVEVNSQLFGRNSAARGEAEVRAAALRESTIRLEQVERAIAAGVRVAAEALRSGQLELERSEEAVRLYRTVVANEERKFGIGMSTLFDVLQAEEGLANALLQQISARERYAAARARLSFESGTLVRAEETELVEPRLPAPAGGPR